MATRGTRPVAVNRGVRKGVGGFTLIELLVVIAIIALLISILLPSLSEARNMGRRGVEGSNIRQLNLASTLYNDDFDGWFVPLQQLFTVRKSAGNGRFTTGSTQSVVTEETTFRVFLFPYVSEVAEVFDSPGAEAMIYADGLSADDIMRALGRVPAGAEDPYLYGVVHRFEEYNQSGIGINGAHYWHSSYPNEIGSRSSANEGNRKPFRSLEARTPFGRPFMPGPDVQLDRATGLSGGQYPEGMAKVDWVEASTECITFGSGGTQHQSWPEDNWWIYQSDTSRPVVLAGFDRYEQAQRGNDPGAIRWKGKSQYGMVDGSVTLLDPRNSEEPGFLPCTNDRCFWSVTIDGHTEGYSER